MTSQQTCSPFAVPAESYDRLMGRYLPSLGPAFADAAEIRGGMRLLDVGCGPGGLTRELAARAGAGQVAAIDPSPPFVAACRERNPGWTCGTASPKTCPSLTPPSTPRSPAWSSGS